MVVMSKEHTTIEAVVAVPDIQPAYSPPPVITQEERDILLHMGRLWKSDPDRVPRGHSPESISQGRRDRVAETLIYRLTQ